MVKNFRGMLDRDELDKINEFMDALADGSLKAKDLDKALAVQPEVVQMYVGNFFRNYNAAEEGYRTMPFQEKLKTRDVAAAYGLDERRAQRIYQPVEDQAIVRGLQARMGVDADTPPAAEPSLKETIEASYDLHTEGGRRGVSND